MGKPATYDDTPMRSFAFRLPASYVAALDREAAARNKTRGELMRRLIERAGIVPTPRPSLQRRDVTPRFK